MRFAHSPLSSRLSCTSSIRVLSEQFQNYQHDKGRSRYEDIKHDSAKESRDWPEVRKLPTHPLIDRQDREEKKKGADNRRGDQYSTINSKQCEKIYPVKPVRR